MLQDTAVSLLGANVLLVRKNCNAMSEPYMAPGLGLSHMDTCMAAPLLNNSTCFEKGDCSCDTDGDTDMHNASKQR
jgi:hypothetical protein